MSTKRRPMRAFVGRLSIGRALVGGLRPAVLVLAVAGVVAPATAAYAEPSIPELQREIEAQSAQLETVVEEYNKVNEELKANRAAADKISADLVPLTDELATASTRVSEIAATVYKGAPLAELSAVFASGDPSLIVERMTTLDQITRFEHGQLVAFSATKSHVDAEKARLDQLVAEQTAKQQSLEERKTKINADIGRLNTMVEQAYAARRAAAAPAPVSAPAAAAAATPPPYVEGKAGIAVSFAYAQLGKPYEWGADGPNSYDCSGLTMAAWRAAGVYMPHNAAMQYNSLPHISRSALRPGDLVFYRSLSHVAIYVGGGQVIHAPTFNDHVRVASVDIMSPYGYARPS